jgi:hypothetical protein
MERRFKRLVDEIRWRMEWAMVIQHMARAHQWGNDESDWKDLPVSTKCRCRRVECSSITLSSLDFPRYKARYCAWVNWLDSTCSSFLSSRILDTGKGEVLWAPLQQSTVQYNTIQANGGNKGYQQLRSIKKILVGSNTQGTKSWLNFLWKDRFC